MNEKLELTENEALNKTDVSSSYDWLKEVKTCWTVGSVGFPVEVEIISLDFDNKIAELKTQYQKGSLAFSELYKSEMSCPCR